MKKRLITGLAITGIVILATLALPPFLLPAPVYDLMYGWRYPKSWDVGDAWIEDRGPDRATKRYRVELADLSSPGRQEVELQLSRLPRIDFTLGVDVVMAPGSELMLDAKSISSMVYLKVVNERNEVVIDESAPLDAMVWNTWGIEPRNAFVYARGKSVELSLGGDTTTYVREGERADQGWGSYFTPRRRGRYTVSLVIDERDPGLPLSELRLVAYGGGWK